MMGMGWSTWEILDCGNCVDMHASTRNGVKDFAFWL